MLIDEVTSSYEFITERWSRKMEFGQPPNSLLVTQKRKQGRGRTK